MNKLLCSVSCLILFFCLYCCPALFAQTPRTIGYQGVLTDGGGAVVTDGNYQLTFRLYDAATGGTASWTESQTAATVKGVFSVLLGSATPLRLLFDSPLWLGVSVGAGAELAPRIPLASVAWSIRAQRADTAGHAVGIVDGQVVRSLNGATDAVTIQGAGGATVTTNGGVITVTAAGGGTGIQGVQNSNNTLDIVNPNGPTATINVRDQGIGTAQLADGAVTAPKIPLPMLLQGTAGTALFSVRNDGPEAALQGNAAAGAGVAGYSATGNGVYGSGRTGVYGESSEDGGEGVTGYGRGSNTEGVLGLSDHGRAVYGISDGWTAVVGLSRAPAGPNAIGVLGTCEAGIGVSGVSLSLDGVRGVSQNNVGVHGISNAAGGNFAVGVEGFCAAGYGVYGHSSGNDGVRGESGTSNGVRGQSAGANVSGVYGANADAGGYGVFGRNTARNTTGYLGGEFGAQGARGDCEGFLGFSDGGVLGRYGTGGPYAYLGMSQWACYISGGLYQNGGVIEVHPSSTTWTTNKPATVKLRDGSKVKLFAEEAAEVYFSDYGEGRLAGGRAHVELDPTFLETVTIDARHPMKVFVQLEGDCNGVFVTNKSASGFDVVELGGGRSGAAFSYRVVCKRAYYEDERLASQEEDTRYNTEMLRRAWPEVMAEKDARDAALRRAHGTGR
jgi:hypothetical protein